MVRIGVYVAIYILPAAIRFIYELRTQLNGVSNEICDKIEDHEKHMDSELDDIEHTLSNQINQARMDTA